MIKFTQECDGYKVGEIVTMDAGVEDAYVNYRGAAEYVNELRAAEHDAKKIHEKIAGDDALTHANLAIDSPPSDKMMRKPKAKK